MKRLLPSAHTAIAFAATRAQTRRTFAIIALAGALLTSQDAVRADATTESFRWEQANARLAAAQKPDDFLSAARCYNRLVADGVRNGPLFSNLGTALLLAGDGPNAVAALQRAERYAGSTPEIRANLRLARALRAGQPDSDLPWDRIVFPWHFDHPLRLRVTVALSCWALLWFGVLLRFLVPPRPADELAAPPPSSRLRTLGGSCIFFGALLALAFGASAAFSWLQERSDDRSWPERVFVCHEAPGAPR